MAPRFPEIRGAYGGRPLSSCLTVKIGYTIVQEVGGGGFSTYVDAAQV